MNKKIIFLIRAYNDIDHSAPLIYYLSKEFNVEVYSKIPLNYILPNDNIEYLLSRNIKVKYLFKNYLNFKDKFLEKIYQIIYKSNQFINPNEFFQIFFNKILKFVHKRINYSLIKKKNWEKDLLSNVNYLLIDWSDINSFPYLNLVKYSKQKKIPIIGIPHGVKVFTNKVTIDKKTIEKRRELKPTTNFSYDFIFVQNESAKNNFVRDGFSPKKIIILGSSRYDDLWLKKLDKIYEKYLFRLNNLFSNNNHNIVLFLTKLHYNVDKNKLLNMIKDLSSLENINLIIKPHTRGMKTNFFKINFKDTKRVKIVDNSIPSFALSKWCNAGIVWGSSIGIQLIVDNKNLIYPKFLHSNQTIYDVEYLKNCIVLNSKDLIKKIKSLNSNKNITYNLTQRNKFMNDIINNHKKYQPLVRHSIFLREVINE